MTRTAMRLFSRVLTILLFGALPLGGAGAEQFRLGLLHGDAEVFAYEIGVLRLALKHAPGNHTLEIVPLAGLPQERMLRQLESGDAAFNIFFSGFSPERETRFFQVDFPITRGLLGHRVFIVRSGWSRNRDQLCDLDIFRQNTTIGSGRGWPDTDIFENAGFEVIAGDYQNLWRMLEFRRYDAFNRGIHEAFIEIEQQKRAGRSFEIDNHLMVTYPFDYFFYLNNDDAGLGRIVGAGLQRAHRTGAFMRYFNAHPVIARALSDATPEKRCILHLDNPFLSQRIRAIPKEYWLRF